jgi:hypothetical protein
MKKKIGTIKMYDDGCHSSLGNITINKIENGTGMYTRYDIALTGKLCPKLKNKEVTINISNDLVGEIVMNYLISYPNSAIAESFKDGTLKKYIFNTKI